MGEIKGLHAELNLLVKDANQARALAKFATDELDWKGTEDPKDLVFFIKNKFQELRGELTELKEQIEDMTHWHDGD